MSIGIQLLFGLCLICLSSSTRAEPGAMPQELLGHYNVIKNLECAHKGHIYDPDACIASTGEPDYLSGALRLFVFNSEGKHHASFAEELPYSHQQVLLDSNDARDPNGIHYFNVLESVTASGFKYFEGYERPDGWWRKEIYELKHDEGEWTYTQTIEGHDSTGDYSFLRRFLIQRTTKAER